MSTGRIHVLGLGNLGLLYAHGLATITPSPPPVTLLFHRAGLLKEWEAAGRKIEITTNDVANSEGKFDVEDLTSSSTSPEAIRNLIVTTKTIKTKQAIESVRHRLGRSSAILFCQNGMGTLEEVIALFPDEHSRPNFLTAITSHGVYSTGKFRSVHAGVANVTIGHNSRVPDSRERVPTSYLLEMVVSAKVLAASQVSSEELMNLQLDKFVANTMINPLTAIFRCRNGELFGRPGILKLMRALLKEVSLVLQALPEVDESNKERFSERVLEQKVLEVAEKTKMNSSSMFQDVTAGRQTEIEYINGWVVKKGQELDLKTTHNEKLVEMVKRELVIEVEDIEKHFRV